MNLPLFGAVRKRKKIFDLPPKIRNVANYSDSMSASQVTLKQIADACELSLSTVCAALNNGDDRYSKETVRYVRKVADRLGYRVNHQAKILRGARSGLLGIIKSASLHQSTAEMAIHAGDAIRATGYRFFSSDLYVNSSNLAHALDIMRDARVEGILIENQAYRSEYEILISKVIKGNIPIVLIDGYPFDGVPYVGPDYYKGFSELTSHFVQSGYRDIALALSEGDLAAVNENFTTKGASNWRVNEAVRAVRDVTSRHRIKMEVMAMPANADSRELEDIYFSPGGEFIRNLAQFRSCPRAIIFINDLFAMAALRACVDAGLKVPDEVAIAGCDDSAIAHYTVPRLTSIAIPTSEMSRKAVRLLTDIIHKKTTGPPRIFLPTKLAVQESCGGRKAHHLAPHMLT